MVNNLVGSDNAPQSFTPATRFSPSAGVIQAIGYFTRLLLSI